MKTRVDWVDIAKGICIIMVVMMHTTLGVGEALGTTGFMHRVVEFAKPFRMPDFFLISGLFLATVIDRDWRTYLDRKVVHFAYFYALWTAIQLTLKAPMLIQAEGVGSFAWLAVSTLWAPFGTMWFLYMLPVFFVVTKLLRHQPAVLLGLATGLYLVHPQVHDLAAAISPKAFMLSEFALRFVFFVIGYLGATYIFRLMDLVRGHRAATYGALALWFGINGWLTATHLSDLPVIGLPLGLAGAMAIAAIATLLAETRVGTWLAYPGEHSIAVYLTFFLPMAVTRSVLIKLGFTDAGWIALTVTTVAFLAPLVLYWLTEKTGHGRFLFNRPKAFWLKGTVKPRPGAAVAAE